MSASASPALAPCGMQAVPDVVVVLGGGEDFVVVGGGDDFVVVGGGADLVVVGGGADEVVVTGAEACVVVAGVAAEALEDFLWLECLRVLWWLDLCFFVVVVVVAAVVVDAVVAAGALLELEDEAPQPAATKPRTSTNREMIGIRFMCILKTRTPSSRIASQRLYPRPFAPRRPHPA